MLPARISGEGGDSLAARRTLPRLVKEQQRTSIGQKRAPQTQEITEKAKKTKNNGSIKALRLAP
jgi:hypothetical protein